MTRHRIQCGRPSERLVRATFLVASLGIGLFLTSTVHAEDVPYPHGEFEDDCSVCHSPRSWHPAVISERFDHGRVSEFPLDGAHRTAMCRSCHLSLDFAQADSKCVSCHLDAHNGELGVDCAQCHSTTNFIDHADEVRSHRTTRFPLTGAHTTLDCMACHPTQPSGGLRYVNTPMDCESCHLDAFMRTTEPNHVALEFDRDCAACHGTATWNAVRFDQFDHTVTGFPLIGAHRSLDCAQCHIGGGFTGVGADCLTCHQSDYDSARSPDHVAGGFPTDCQQCHGSQAWTPAEFNHELTGFSLTGSHGGLTCEQCHTDGTRTAIESSCESCHRLDYEDAPSHVSSNFPLTCEECHNTVGWGDAVFNHDFFPFVGGHSGLGCEQCHTTGVYETIPADCQSCHRSDYQEAPGHVSGGFPTTCEDCHSLNTWAEAAFYHDIFPLTHAHDGIDCVRCHTDGSFGTISADCISCHQDSFQTAPGHVASGFSQDCMQCHSTTTWVDWSYDHGFFPLDGAHNGVHCASCHASGTYGTIPADCFSCHDNAYQQAPGHAGSFPTTCEDCHSVTAWADATFDHAFFPLNGAHNGVQCASCHASGTYGTIPADCFSCHDNDYQQAPGHVGSFPTTCDDCHTVTTWQNAVFDHSIFPLTGGHNGPTCQQCHTGGTYGTIPSDCIFCHQADYVEAPSHVASNFPQDCRSCHSITVWSNATLDHSFFPLNGGHNGLQCIACHTLGVYATIPADCFSCHQSDYASAPDHQSLNFPHDCESCHDTSNWQNTNFFHSFPLNGPHGGRDCTECHISGTTEDFSCYGTCHEHTQSEAANDHSGVSGYAYDFQLCLSCHPDGRE